jgi:hypothetical protein
MNGWWIYVRIGSTTGSGWRYVDYTYIAAIPVSAALISPANGATLPGSTVTFHWSAGVGVSQYRFSVSKIAPGGTDLDNIDTGSQTTSTLTNLPLDGSTIYVRLSSLLGSNWQYVDYSFTAAGRSLAVAMISPPNGAALPGSTAVFQWSAGVGVSQYWLYVSALAPGGQEIYSGSQGSNTSKTFAGLPTNGSTIYVRLWSEIDSVWQFSDYSYQSAAALTRIATPTDSTSLAAYLAATPFSSFDFFNFPDWDYVTPPTSTQLSDGVLSLTFSPPMVRFTVTPNGWNWGVAPTSARANANALLPILDAYNPLFNPRAAWDSQTNWFALSNLTITFSRPVWTFGFEAEPDEIGTITATFYTASSESLTIEMDALSSLQSQSRIFAATGAPIVKVAIALTNPVDYPDFAIGGFRYALTGAVAPDLSQASGLSQAATPAPAVMISPANGATLPGSTATLHWSTGVGVSEYWLYLSKVEPGGKEIYSSALWSNTSMTVTTLPIDGSTLYVRLWSQIGTAWQYADYSYKTATIH